MSGRLIGIARRDAHRAPMEELQVGSVSIERGLERDHKGAKFPRRQITVMSIEAWQAANAELADLPDQLYCLGLRAGPIFSLKVLSCHGPRAGC